ncbi:MAG: hypothetical protein F6J93_40040 [Oscillatoria sp. SIO1A7]|nr:hypothetical protein [Oscillatoria sp. SIO1A7]
MRSMREELDKSAIADFDNTWKQALKLYFRALLLFLFPEIHDIIDWKHHYIKLKTDLELTVNSQEPKGIANQLFQARSKEGESIFILISIEIDSKEDIDFIESIHYYNCRAVGQYKRPVISLGILADRGKSWRSRKYKYAKGKYKKTMEFPIAKLVDYQSRWEELEASTNPFAIAVSSQRSAVSL